MKSIYKYPLGVVVEQTLKLPKYSTLLSVQVQNGTPCLWAVVDTDPQAETEDLTVYVIGTGWKMPEDVKTWVYLDTFQLHGGALVYHVFRGPSPDVTKEN